MNCAAKQLVIKKRIQKKKHFTKYWSQKLEAQKREIDFNNKNHRHNPSHENARILKN